MTVWLHFGGWFQCRLSTDPDPADEPRGVSGYAQAIAGEPDLDRVIRFQPEGTVQRQFCPEAGVDVVSVVVDGEPVAGHPLVGAAVDLLDDAKFEGRNGVVAEDGFEPIVPFHLQVSKDAFRLRRKHVDQEQFPFSETASTGVQPGLADVAEATGIWDLSVIWRDRLAKVDAALAASDDPVVRAALTKRRETLTNPALARFFPVRMLYSVRLQGRFDCADPGGWLPGRPTASPWLVDLWFGGWDADAFCGFVKGVLRLDAGQPAASALRGPSEPSPAFAPDPRPPRAPRRP